MLQEQVNRKTENETPKKSSRRTKRENIDNILSQRDFDASRSTLNDRSTINDNKKTDSKRNSGADAMFANLKDNLIDKDALAGNMGMGTWDYGPRNSHISNIVS